MVPYSTGLPKDKLPVAQQCKHLKAAAIATVLGYWVPLGLAEKLGSTRVRLVL